MFLKNNIYFISLLAGVITIIISYCNCYMCDKKKRIKEYTKEFVFISLLVGAVMYWLNNSKTNNLEGGTSEMLDMYIGEPNF